MAIVLTQAAVDYIKKSLSKRGKGEGLRVGVKKSGCSGFAYALDFTDSVTQEDRVFEQQGVKIIVDEKSLPYLEGIELDFVREGLNQSFKFNNPNVKGTCGCGESFSV